MPDLTENALIEMMAKFKAPEHVNSLIYTVFAVSDTEERLFPASKNRSSRIRKKLLRRYGGEFRRAPCAYRIGNTLYVHPALRAEIESRFSHASKEESPPSDAFGYMAYTLWHLSREPHIINMAAI